VRQRIAAVALEVGAGQAGGVAELLRASGFSDVACIRDLAGMERVVAAERARG
jgi:methylase of polypeptide subunit release factors